MLAAHIVRNGCALICLLTCGCQSANWQMLRLWPTAAEDSAEGKTQIKAGGDAPEDRKAPESSAPTADNTATKQPIAALPLPGLPDDRWVMNVRPMAPGKQEPAWRWHHPALDATFALPESRRPELATCLNNANPVVAANAAILIGRWGSDACIEALAAAAQNVNLKLPLRQAAIETLGSLPSEAAVSKVDVLLGKPATSPTDTSALSAISELYAELLAARAKHVDPSQDERFRNAARSKATIVRQETAAAFARSETPLGEATPRELFDLCEDTDTRVRVAALTAIAKHRPPNAAEVLTRATHDYDLNVRIAAISALGELGNKAARQSLDKLRQDPSEIARAAAIGALAAVGADAAILAAATDRSPQVRQAVAESLKEWKGEAETVGREAEALAKELVQDASTEVQRRAVESLRDWPLEQAGPALLLAMEKGGFLTRKLAAEQLAERWQPAAGFTASAKADRRAEQIAELQASWQKQFGSLDQQIVRAAATEAVKTIGLSDEQLAALDKTLEQLASDDERLRRAAASELVTLLNRQRLSELALNRLSALVESETDPIVWQAVLTAIADDPRATATRLAYIAVANASSEVRRRACRHLELHPSRDHLEVLLPMFDDENLTVAIAAVRAIGAAGVSDPKPLVRLLNRQDRQLRLASAIALAQSQFDTGLAAIERLSHETDLEIRRAATVAMGEIGDAQFLPRLMILIDDRRDIQLAALSSLTAIAGKDFSRDDGVTVLPDEQVRRWKQWYAERTGTMQSAGD